MTADLRESIPPGKRWGDVERCDNLVLPASSIRDHPTWHRPDVRLRGAGWFMVIEDDEYAEINAANSGYHDVRDSELIKLTQTGRLIINWM